MEGEKSGIHLEGELSVEYIFDSLSINIDGKDVLYLMDQFDGKKVSITIKEE